MAGLLNDSYAPPAGAVYIAPGSNIQSVINQHGAGTAYVLGAGTFSGQTFQPRSGDSFFGQEGTVLDGNGADHAVNGWHISDVTIANITFTDYAPSANGSGVLGTDPSSSGWRVTGNEFHDIARGAAVMLGNDMLVQDNSFRDNASNGVASWDVSGATVRNNLFDHNNTSGASPFRDTGEGSAIKITQSTGTQIVDNDVRDTVNGMGIWADINCDDTLIQGNHIEGNGAAGISLELDYGATVRGNTVVGNNTSLFEGFQGGGIYVFNAQDADISGNVFVGNGGGVWVYEENRGSGTQGTWLTRNVDVRDNVIIADQGRTGIGGQATNDGSITFEGNDYNLTGGATFYDGRPVSAAEWQARGHDGGAGFAADAGAAAPSSGGGAASAAPAADGAPGTLVLAIAQDAWNGNARYTVSVDGVQQGGTRTASAAHGSGEYDMVEITGDWSPGQHSVEVAFVNDAWGGAGGGDRNLYVEAASYDGAAIGGAAALYTAGTHDLVFTA